MSAADLNQDKGTNTSPILPPKDRDSQKELLNFIKDPETIKKAVEGSMNKRAAVLYPEDSLDSIISNFTNTRLPDDPDESDRAELAAELKAFFLAWHRHLSTKELLDKLPEKRADPHKGNIEYGVYMGYNRAIDDVRAALTREEK